MPTVGPPLARERYFDRMPDQPITHLEPLLDAAIAALRTNLDAAIAAVNAAHSDFPLDDVPSDAILLGGFDTAVFPMIEVAAPDWTLTRISVGQIAGTLDLSLVVKVTAIDYTPELLYRRLLRYVSAIIAVLLDPAALGGGVYVDKDRGIRGSYRFNPETGEQDNLTGSGVLVVYLTTDETRP